MRCLKDFILYLNLFVFSTVIQINKIKSTSYVIIGFDENRIYIFIIASNEVPNFGWVG